MTVVGIPVLTGDLSQSGSFLGGMSIGGPLGLGIDSGIILSSGRAIDAVGPNDDAFTKTAFGGSGDPSLDLLLGDPQSPTSDAVVLEFEFNFIGGDLSFSYVFASDEYPRSGSEAITTTPPGVPPNLVPDVFGFFLDGVNIASLPGDAAVSTVNVNCGNEEFGGVASNIDLYNDNDLLAGCFSSQFPPSANPFDIEYDGFTDVLTASAIGVGPGIHHIKLAIADARDEVVDSAVFIKAGTSTATPAQAVAEPSVLALYALGVAGLLLPGLFVQLLSRFGATSKCPPSASPQSAIGYERHENRIPVRLLITT